MSATANATTTYGYDETGAKVTQLDAEGRTTTWTIDGNGRVTARRIQDGSQETNQYDGEGNRIGKTTFAGEALTFQYDAENRLKSLLVPQGAGGSAIAASSLIYNYTAGGQLASQQESGATTLAGTQSYRYDANDRLVEMRNPIGVLQWGLDAAGNITERSVSGVGTVRYEYDAAGRMQKVVAPDGKEARYTYDAAGRLVTTERDLNAKDGQPQVLVTYQRYDSADRMLAIAHLTRVAGVETLVAGQAMTRGAGGAINRIDTHRAGSTFDAGAGIFGGTAAVTQGFEYDGNARLTRETRTKGGETVDTVYEYSPAGNRTKKTVTTAAGAAISLYRYDAADRLIEEAVSLPAGGSRTTGYGWDGNGNLASKTEAGRVTLYRFDPQNRLIDIRTGTSQAEAAASSPAVSYAYDANGNRIRKTTPQGTSGYLIDSTHSYAQVAAEASGAQQVAYVRGIELVRQVRQGSNSSENLFPLHGHLGTSVGAVNSDGSVAEEVEFDAFGVLLIPNSPKQDYLYTGEYWDQDAQLLYLRARWYDPTVGRFVSADPFQGKHREPRSLNRYAYTHNDPVGSRSGLFLDLNSTFIAGSIQNTTRASGAASAARVLVRVAMKLLVVGVALTPRLIDSLEECSNNANDSSCDVGMPAIFFGSQHAAHAALIKRAYLSGTPLGPLTYSFANERSEASRQWYATSRECYGKTGHSFGLDCDEFPYFKHLEGGPEKYEEGLVQLEPMDAGENRSAGSTWGNFLRACRVIADAGPASKHLVIPLPPGTRIRTFWVGPGRCAS